MTGVRLLSLDDLHDRGIRYHRESIRRLVRLGRFPRPVKLGQGPTAPNAWPEHEIDAWLLARMEERDAAAQTTHAAAASPGA
jgi:prophage regulatory protein